MKMDLVSDEDDGPQQSGFLKMVVHKFTLPRAVNEHTKGIRPIPTQDAFQQEWR